jgi:hypothetical protein
LLNETKEKRVIKRRSSAMVMAGMLFLAVAGCQPAEGPAEKAGKALDQTLSNMGEQIQKAGDEIQASTRVPK